MANYTKIGRIRPDYADVWDSARSYTALEMVKSADSYHAYIAKRDVPAGTPLTDADYWGEVLDVSDVIAESVAAAERANAAAEAAEAFGNGLRGRGSAIVCAEEGEVISISDASDDALRGLRIFGRTEQDGTPSPVNPVPLVSAGDKGSIGVTVTGKDSEDKPIQTLTALTPNGLPGIPVTSGGNYTDADGQQWVCDEVDFERGVYVKRTGVVDMGTLEWSYSTNYTVFTTSVQDIKPSTLVMLCTHYPTSPVSSAASAPDMSIYGRSDGGGTGGLGVKNSNYTDAASFKAAMSGAKTLYELAAPIETPLTAGETAAYRAMHTNYPNTAAFSDAGAHMEVKYNADTKTYIDNKFNALAAQLVSSI